MSDSCETCKYRHLYKELVNGTWIKRDCCIVWTRDPECGDEYNSFVIPINPDDVCEMYTEKRTYGENL